MEDLRRACVNNYIIGFRINYSVFFVETTRDGGFRLLFRNREVPNFKVFCEVAKRLSEDDYPILYPMVILAANCILNLKI